MKNKIFSLIIALLAFASVASAAEDKKAIVMVHYGSSVDQGRQEVLDSLNLVVAQAFPDYKVVEAYTSPMVIRKLASRGIQKDSVTQALMRLAADGYTDVVLQGSHVIDGGETAIISSSAAKLKQFFKKLRIGRPLLCSTNDYDDLTNLLIARYGNPGKDTGIVLVGHGTALSANSAYCEVEYMLRAKNHPEFFVTTIESYPDVNLTLKQLKDKKIKRVVLVPLLFTTGNHVMTDVNGEIRELLEANGIEVTVHTKGLGSDPDVRNLYINHLRDAINK